MKKSPIELRKIYTLQAIKTNRKSNNETWKSCLFCSMVVGKYVNSAREADRDSTRSLAEEMNVSPDTVEDRAHAYFIFRELCEYKDGRYRLLVFQARRLDFIYWSHFRALWDAKRSYNLNTFQIFELLMDVVSAEGDLSSRDIDRHTKERFGVERPWTYYAARANKSIAKVLESPDTPKDVRDILLQAFNKLGEI